VMCVCARFLFKSVVKFFLKKFSLFCFRFLKKERPIKFDIHNKINDT